MSPRFQPGDLIWYRAQWSAYNRDAKIPGTVVRVGATGYWVFVQLLRRDGSRKVQRVRSTHVTRRDPEEPYR